jgi:hypothetical protein
VHVLPLYIKPTVGQHQRTWLTLNNNNNNNNNNSVDLVRQRTAQTERLPLIGEVRTKFADRGVSRSQRDESPTTVFSVFSTGATTFSFKQLLNCTHEVGWTPFQTHYFSEIANNTKKIICLNIICYCNVIKRYQWA